MPPMQLHRAEPNGDGDTGDGVSRDRATGPPPDPDGRAEPASWNEEKDAESADRADHAESSAAELADRPRLWRALLFAHQPDRHGRCAACVGVTWPCAPRKLAEHAEQTYNGRRGKDSRP